MAKIPHDPNEFLPVVDSKDNVVGKAIRKEIHEKGLLHREASVLLTNTKGEILLQRRKDNGSIDYSASGHVPYGEDYLTTAIRETEEELGLKIPKNKFSKISKRRFVGKELTPNNRFVCLFAVEGDYKIKDMHIDNKEVESVRYYTTTAVRKIIFDKAEGYGFTKMLNDYVTSSHS